MAKPKAMTEAKSREPLKLNMDFDEAMRRVLQVKPEKKRSKRKK